MNNSVFHYFDTMHISGKNALTLSPKETSGLNISTQPIWKSQDRLRFSWSVGLREGGGTAIDVLGILMIFQNSTVLF